MQHRLLSAFTWLHYGPPPTVTRSLRTSADNPLLRYYIHTHAQTEHTCFPNRLAVSWYSPCLVLWNTMSPNLARRYFQLHRLSFVPSNMSVTMIGRPTDAMCWMKSSSEGVLTLGISLSRGRSELSAATVRNSARADCGSISRSKRLASLS